MAKRWRAKKWPFCLLLFKRPKLTKKGKREGFSGKVRFSEGKPEGKARGREEVATGRLRWNPWGRRLAVTHSAATTAHELIRSWGVRRVGFRPREFDSRGLKPALRHGDADFPPESRIEDAAQSGRSFFCPI